MIFVFSVARLGMKITVCFWLIPTYMGTRSKWEPKCCTDIWVYHVTLFQRFSLPSSQMDRTVAHKLSDLVGLFHTMIETQIYDIVMGDVIVYLFSN